jgi:hypothetical protein
MDKLTGSDVLACKANGLTVLDYRGAFCQIYKGDLVTERDRLSDGDLAPAIGT